MHLKYFLSNFFLILVLSVDVDVSARKFITLPAIKTIWNTYDFNLIDLGVGAGGDIFLIKSDGNLYNYKLNEKDHATSNITPLNYPVSLNRLDVDRNGTPFIVDINGNTIYLNCAKMWKALPGCARDIGVGANGDVWKIGCDQRVGGFGVWKLICSGCKIKNNCIKISSSNNYYFSPNFDKKCNWYRVNGSGVRIDVDPEGNPWIVKNNGEIYSYDGKDWHLVPGFLGKDITISNEGVTFASGIDYSIGRLVSPQLGTWQILSGSAIEISAGAYSIPFIISKNGEMQTVLDMN